MHLAQTALFLNAISGLENCKLFQINSIFSTSR
uniref:Uncharacterized protein n=1 Tax=Rhizophora mucronata TaxID=61149 RepID=A0A2P2Q7Q9_RHIMU